jgi:hypothetical protein
MAGWVIPNSSFEGGCFGIRLVFVYTSFPTHAVIQLQREA